MRSWQWIPLILALLSLWLMGCPGKADPDNGKPAASPEVSLAGVDTSSLTARERREWAAQVSELLAPCPDTPVNIAQCVKEQRPCKLCLPAALLLLRQVQAGRAKPEREQAFHARFDANKVRTLSLDGSPEIGPADAPITIVEWADFECPFCRLIYPLLEELIERYDGQVRLVFKVYPLDAHPHGEIAARAAIAAKNQGKFWEMHHVLFDNQDRLEQADLERYAKQLKLDLPKFRQDFTSEETSSRITKDKQQADGLGLKGTPMLFINGREVVLEHLVDPREDLDAWVRLDLEQAGLTPKAGKLAPGSSAAPTTQATAAPSAAPTTVPTASATASSGKP